MSIFLYPDKRFQEFFRNQNLGEQCHSSSGYQTITESLRNNLVGSHNKLTSDFRIRLHPNCTLKVLEEIITHEIFQKVITELEGWLVSQQFENISEDFFGRTDRVS